MLYKVEYPECRGDYYITKRGTGSRVENESVEVEGAKVHKALEAFADGGHLPSTDYNERAFTDLREAVRANYEITWTSITPPMERLLYAISSIKRPRNMVCLGIFCGNTVTWNVGSASGPGKSYDASHLVGVEIEPGPSTLARRNLDSIGMDDVEILCEDGFETIARIDYPIDLLYLDAMGYDPDSGTPSTKLIYLSMLKRALPKLAPDAVILAHDVLIPEFDGPAKAYLDYVRDSASFSASFCVEIDEEGLEVTFR